MHWNSDQTPVQAGKIALVTGGGSGIGYALAKLLLAKKFRVIIACRDLERGRQVVQRLSSRYDAPRVSVIALDLLNLRSVQRASEELNATLATLDLLINNAGVAFPPFGQSDEGVETQMATNHLGHFVLTAQLMNLLRGTPDARIINLTSLAHFAAPSIEVGFSKDRRYSAFQAYALSKLANVLFTYQLQQRLDQHGIRCRAVAAHPGSAKTNLLQTSGRNATNLSQHFFQFQSADSGALCPLRAALDPNVRGGECIGPAGPFQLFGHPIRVRTSARSYSIEQQNLMWSLSERAAGIDFLSFKAS